MNHGAMLNAYPDSMGGKLGDIAALLSRPEFKDVFRSFYILPSLFQSDLDRGFCVMSYDLNPALAAREDLERFKALGMDLKLDFVLNHLSVQSPQFQDLLKNGDQSAYRDFFIDWNKFWAGRGTMNAKGYVDPDPELIRDMFFRKPGLPILMVRMPDGREVPFWNTFYQQVWEENGQRRYLGQMDLNLKSPLVWRFYQDTLRRLADYGASVIRLDAFAYAPKEPGRRNFLNEPETSELLERIRQMASPLQLELLPEIHASYAEGNYREIARQGYVTYDFFLPGLIIDAIEFGKAQSLAAWACELRDRRIRTVNMLGSHDGIPLLDLKGLLPEERIQQLIDLIVSRGGLVKNLHGQQNVYYQVNATYFSALGEDERKLLLARALQLFMPGKPQVWYLDLFAGKNDLAAVERGGAAGHKEINRTNLTREDVEEGLKRPVVQKQLALLRLRNTCPAFGFDAALEVEVPADDRLTLRWRKDGTEAELTADLTRWDFDIRVNGRKVLA